MGALAEHAREHPGLQALETATLAEQADAVETLLGNLEAMVTGLQSRLALMVRDMRALGLHVGVNRVCVTCGVEWPCPHAEPVDDDEAGDDA